jgi:hypothetical protein
MGCDVYANGDEIACKAGDGKVIAAFPDVCLTPPPPPAGPLPIPYPDTSFSKDMQSGSKTVKIKGKEVMLKDSSFYKTAPLGNEAATNGQGAGVITHVITGKTYFVAWSMDVKFEGENVDRHSDMTTSNHASPNPNTPSPQLNLSAQEAANLAANLCVCDPTHGEHCANGTPMTMAEWYTTDASGNPLPPGNPRIDEYNALVIDVANRKNLTPPCTCNGRVVPSPPCHVFFKPVEADEYEDIVTTASGDPWRAFKATLPKAFATDAAAQNAIKWQCQGVTPSPGQLNHDAQLERQGNHLTPKAAGGCPMGNNVEHQQNLCGRCRSFEARFTSLQGA